MAAQARPTQYPRWATDVSADVVEPNSGRMDTGWLGDDVAGEGEFNWLQLRNYEWLRYLAERSPQY